MNKLINLITMLDHLFRRNLWKLFRIYSPTMYVAIHTKICHIGNYLTMYLKIPNIETPQTQGKK